MYLDLSEYTVKAGGWLGVLMEDDGPTHGARVTKVLRGSPAEEAGLAPGDVVVSFAGHEVKRSAGLKAREAATAAGTEVEVVVEREGKRQALNVMLGKVPPEGLVLYYYVGDELGTIPFLASEHPRALAECLDQAREDKAAGVIIEIDTYGGLVDPALKMARLLAQEEEIRTVACIGGDKGAAYSAGALIALGCQEIYMTEDAVIGAAAPVTEDDTGKYANATEKAVSGIAAKFRALAESRGRPPAVAEAMVDPDVELHEVREEGEQSKWVTVRPGGRRPKGTARLVVGRGKLLTLTGKEAAECGFVDGVLPSYRFHDPRPAEDVREALGLPPRLRYKRGDAAIRELWELYVEVHDDLEALRKKYNTLTATVNRIGNKVRVLPADSPKWKEAARLRKKYTHQRIDLLKKTIVIMEKHNAAFLGAFADSIQQDRDLLFQLRSSYYGK